MFTSGDENAHKILASMHTRTGFLYILSSGRIGFHSITGRLNSSNYQASRIPSIFQALINCGLFRHNWQAGLIVDGDLYVFVLGRDNSPDAILLLLWEHHDRIGPQVVPSTKTQTRQSFGLSKKFSLFDSTRIRASIQHAYQKTQHLFSMRSSRQLGSSSMKGFVYFSCKNISLHDDSIYKWCAVYMICFNMILLLYIWCHKMQLIYAKELSE